MLLLLPKKITVLVHPPRSRFYSSCSNFPSSTKIGIFIHHISYLIAKEITVFVDPLKYKTNPYPIQSKTNIGL
jgi:hypothetical protein